METFSLEKRMPHFRNGTVKGETDKERNINRKKNSR